MNNDSPDTSRRWSEVYNELRSHQSLTSVINNPSQTKPPGSINELWEVLREGYEDLTDKSVQKEVAGAQSGAGVAGKVLLGPIPEAADFQSYLDTFTDIWEAYARNHKPSKRRPTASFTGDDVAANSGLAALPESVPQEYASADFKLDQHPIFRQPLQISVERQEELNAELSSHLDAIEVALFEHIRKAQREQLFEAVAKMGEPLRDDLQSTVAAVKAMRAQLKSVQRRQLQCGMVVGRLARRKERVAEVLQRLDCLSHVHQSPPTIQMLLQSKDYMTALDLLESTRTALESNLRGLSSMEQGASKLAVLGRDFNRSLELDFVHHSSIAILTSLETATASVTSASQGGAVAAAAVAAGQQSPGNSKSGAAPTDPAASGQPALHNAERLKHLSWCLGHRELLKTTLASNLRDVLLSLLKRAFKNLTKALLDSLARADATAQQGEPSEQQSGGAGADGAAAEPGADNTGSPGEVQPGTEASSKDAEGEASPPAVPHAASTSSDAAAPRAVSDTILLMTGTLNSLSFDGFINLWKQLMQCCIDVAESYCVYAVVIQEAFSAWRDSQQQQQQQSGATDPNRHPPAAAPPPPPPPPPGHASSLKAGRSDHEISLELIRLYEVLLNNFLQKMGVLLKAREKEHKSVKLSNWQGLLRASNDGLDQVKVLHEKCRKAVSSSGSQSAGPAAGSGPDIGGSLRGILTSQTQSIIKEYHEQKLAKMKLVLEQESWERADVPVHYKRILERIIGQEQRGADADGEGQDVERYLRVDGQNYLVVPAVLELLQMLEEYAQLCQDLSSHAVEIPQRMAELLKLFNQEAQRLVLGGQLQRKTMKKLNAANLALCSQCCALVADVLPKLQTRLLNSLQAATPGPADGGASPPAAGAGGGEGVAGGSASSTATIGGSSKARHASTVLLGDLAKIAVEYSDHRKALFDKLSVLLQERYEFHSKKWFGNSHSDRGSSSPPWLAAAQANGTAAQVSTEALSPHEALDGLLKDISSMYRVLLKNLSGESVRSIFTKAFQEIAKRFEARLGEELTAPSPPYHPQAGCSLGDRLVMDIAYLQEQLGNLNGIAQPVQKLLLGMIRHLQALLPADDPAKRVTLAVVEALMPLAVAAPAGSTQEEIVDSRGTRSGVA